MPAKSKIVARYRDARILKGYTLDFMPNKDTFHVVDPEDESRVSGVSASELKAVFYVKTFTGDPGHKDSADFSRESLDGVPGLKLQVTFEDGEVMYGTTNGYTPGRKGFFVFPADKTSNNERVYVFSDATKSVETWR